MMWAAIWLGGRSEIIVMRRDPESSHQGYTQSSYIWALEEGLLPIYRDGYLFQQDNARIHRTPRVTEWLFTHGIETFEWPAHSPDLNPIEHAWKMMKDNLNTKFPGLISLLRNEENKAYFVNCVREAWWAIPQEKIDALIRSIPRRLAAVRRAHGWYTKYLSLFNSLFINI